MKFWTKIRSFPTDYMPWPFGSSPGYKIPNITQRYVIFNTVQILLVFLHFALLSYMTTSLLLRRLCVIRTLVVINVVVFVVFVVAVVVVVSFILFPALTSVVKNRRIFCIIDSSIIRNQKIIMTKYIEQLIFWTTGTNDFKEMFAGTNPGIF